ncbi:fimbrial protein [Escherichia coli]|uniref:Fimbrial protein n=1 Tax=Escherichia coli TaxID=562 RepID=A0A6D0DFD2_ECOLX|nr:fimbrial protein [Escherichia coli]EFA2316620.1 fimbrial protein [Escherichia coli]EFK1738827.1 fimbrial protein [Escherichia coli]EIK3121737.1 fimbrial protein [Escherichia coli]EIZ1217321.1 fimbrial protein [Escherichia coli]EJV4893598.1 fimbrial protein [Escherichia coli]
MKLKVIATLITTVVIGGSFSSNFAFAGTQSASLTVNSNLTAGTCAAALLNTDDTQISKVEFGDVYISELAAKSKVKAFKIRFSGCAGLPQKSASVILRPRTGGCAGPNSTTSNFANYISTSNGGASKASVEVWTTKTPEANGSQQFNCIQRNVVNVDLSTASTTQPFDFDLSARMAIVPGFSISDVTPGDFESYAVFVITYQ